MRVLGPLALLGACGLPRAHDAPGVGRAPTTRTTTATTSSWHYRVTVAPHLDRLDVRITAPRPEGRWVLGLAAGLPALRDVRWEAGDRRAALPRVGAAFLVDSAPPGATLAYSVDVDALADAGHEVRRTVRVGRDVCAAPGLWLLRPASVRRDARATLEFDLPAGVSASTPWPRDDDSLHVLDVSAFRWRSQVAIGRLETFSFDAGGTRFDAALLDGRRDTTTAGIERWLRTAATAVTDLYGTLPAPRVQALVVPVASGDPVAFGMTQRGGGLAAVLLLGSDATDDDLPRDWVAVHEFAHLGHPAIHDADAWFAEGFAQYYTEVLRARAGLSTEREAWEKIARGFERGRAGDTEASLEDESRDMRRLHAYHAVYWGGAAVALRLDVALRGEVGVARSLDDAMRQLSTWSEGGTGELHADEILRRLDAWLGRPLFTATARAALDSREFPETDALLRELGVVVRDGEVTLDDAAPLSRIRHAITALAR